MKIFLALLVGLALGVAVSVSLPVLAQSTRGAFDHPDLADRYGGTYERGIGSRGPTDSERSMGSYTPPRLGPC